MLRFFWLICHKRVHCKGDFTEKAQHRWRWIPLRILTRGRLVPRQPRAIKRTTPTALHNKSSHNEIYIHWNIGIIPTALRGCDIRDSKYIHCNIGIKNTALHHEYIHNGIYIHENIGIISTALHRYHIRNGKYIHLDIGIIPTALHGCNIQYNKYIHCQTITTQMILANNVIYLAWGLIGNNKPVDIKQENDMTQTTGWFDSFQAVKWRRLHDKMRHIAAWTNHYHAMGLRKRADEGFNFMLLA